MDDDFNTPEAYSVLFDMAREVNRLKTEDAAAANAMAAHLRKLAAVLGAGAGAGRLPAERRAG
jgi:cysteinyl-tRNA synthetase